MAGPGVLCGRACHIISKFLAGSMLELVGNPQEYVYVQTPELNSESGDWLTNHLIRRVCESPDSLHCFSTF